MIDRPIIIHCDVPVCHRSLNIPNPHGDRADDGVRAQARLGGWAMLLGMDLCDRCAKGAALFLKEKFLRTEH